MTAARHKIVADIADVLERAGHPEAAEIDRNARTRQEAIQEQPRLIGVPHWNAQACRPWRQQEADRRPLPEQNWKVSREAPAP